MTIHVLGISGSLRKGSYNTAALRSAADLMPEGVTFEIYDELHLIAPYNEDVKQQGYPEAEQRLREKLYAADAFLFAVPEYNSAMPGVLKNAIDWGSRGNADGVQPFAGKAAGLISVATGSFGGVRAQRSAREVLNHMNCLVVNKPEVIIANAKDKFDESMVLSDEGARKFLALHLEALAELTRKLKGA